MADILLGGKIYSGIDRVQMDTADGRTVEFADRNAVEEEASAAGRV